MCCTRLAENTGRKKSPKSRRLGTIPQLCRAISLQLRHLSTIGKKLVKQPYLLNMSQQYGALRPNSGWDRFVSLGHPCKFQRVSLLGSVTARHSRVGVSQTAALNRVRHLYSAGRPSRWAFAHISSYYYYICVCDITYQWLSRLHTAVKSLHCGPAMVVMSSAADNDVYIITGSIDVCIIMRILRVHFQLYFACTARHETETL